jgi:phage shock protein PspC (stress-responsive transcriptional regulator)
MSNLPTLRSNRSATGFGLDKRNGKLMGVCAGLARWTGIDVVWFRVGFVAATLLGIGFPVLLYVLIGLIAGARPA